jgi:hypothetical protein
VLLPQQPKQLRVDHLQASTTVSTVVLDQGLIQLHASQSNSSIYFHLD